MLLFLCASCGMYISSTAFLPSSFAMYLTMVATGAWFLHNYEVSTKVDVNFIEVYETFVSLLYLLWRLVLLLAGPSVLQ